MMRKKWGERRGKGGMNSGGQHEEKRVCLRMSNEEKH
jgi:hypothetical protein